MTGAGLAVALAAVGLGVPAQAAAAETFDVEISVTGKGTVTGAGSYEAGETVELTAAPAKDQVWGGWTSPELGWIGARVGSFTMPAQDVELTTEFRKQIASLKNVYKDYFDVGNIYSHPGTYEAGSPNSATIDRHYSVMTAENNMKPDQLLPNDNIDPETGEFTFSFEQADAFVDQTLARGMKVHGHVLVWHGQSPPRINSGTTGGTRAQAKANMERYIQEVLTHFQGRTVSWDVVNEAFVDGLAEFDPATQDWRDFLRGGPNGGFSNWYSAYANGADAAAGESPADFLYDAFVFARTYGPETRLEYNDFNVFQSEGKAQAIIAMATDLNERYLAEHPEDPRQLVEAIGMQSHNYINQTPAFACSDRTRLRQLVKDSAEEWQPGACSNEASVERSIQLIVEAGFSVSISELDLQVWEAWNGQPEGDDRTAYRDLNDPSVSDRISREGFTYWEGKITNRAELERIQAQRFAEYFAVYKKYSTDINRVTFWGLTDQLSWRSTHNPLIFNSDFSEKLGAVAVADPERWLGLRKPIVDTSKLEEALAQAKALDLRGRDYSGVSIAKVKAALARVVAVLSSGGPQAKVNAATAALLDAVAALEKKPSPPRS
ncbi:endo-1,4-beta-xylanase [Cellulomonas dongxiuzhuiae]|uniref:Endo-1,4-beta-xylanase n=1 Tax=Cellulomonas dongxiuzhuiae TaxID=2819979 RepID=A0ABX8GLI7_9CELL|nr:endo-1,4-beta-xylanase [Cellulomonas dongxiuzhuiae]MBO3088842.1 endo-1,4-beta-xylanase [Cellulomonas dongxiuzhuiae]MBO3096401.1 endo-1,4-beta-xylanase [Cellulomonas dongxiuzhuiae]QWC16810.1 endo-1,4-beta-xylanase [Cellulomonas dongxiuzhuiae]